MMNLCSYELEISMIPYMNMWKSLKKTMEGNGIVATPGDRVTRIIYNVVLEVIEYAQTVYNPNLDVCSAR